MEHKKPKHINRVELLGTVGTDGELREVGANRVARLRLATNRSYKDKQGEWHTNATWHTITGWNDQADILALCRKGDTLHVEEGMIEEKSWIDKTGAERVSVEVKAWKAYIVPRPDRVATTQASSNEPDDGLPF